MEALFGNPAGVVLALCLLGTVFGPMLAIIFLLRGGQVELGRLRRLFTGEAEAWRRAATGHAAAQQHQADQLAELRRRVSDLKSGAESKPESETRTQK
jgi:hypothetical protein